MKILAAVDDSTAAPAVVSCALALARCIPAEVTCLYARGNGHPGVAPRTVQAAADRGLPLTVVEGAAIPVLVDALTEEDVVVGVIASRGHPGGKLPAGHTALAVAGAARKPVVVAPPTNHLGQVRRLLLPLEGIDDGAAMTDFVQLLAAGGVEVVALHVMVPTTVPSCWDQPHHAMAAWSSGFLSRFGPPATDGLEVRSGDIADATLEVIRSSAIDMVALSWSQDLSAGHAPMVRALLARSRVPVLLIPAPGAG